MCWIYLSRGAQADRVAERPHEGRQRHLWSGEADADAGRECPISHAAHLEIHVPEAKSEQGREQTTRGVKNTNEMGGKGAGAQSESVRAHS